MELIDLQQRNDLKIKYIEMNIGEFYRNFLNRENFPHLKKFVASKLALFGLTYVCEQFFSKVGYMKSTHRTALTDEHLENGLRVASTSIKINVNKIVLRLYHHQMSH